MVRKANEAIDENRWPNFIRTPPSSLIHGKSGVRAEFLSDCKALFWKPEFFWPHLQIKCPHCKRKPQEDGWGKIRKVVGLRTSYFVKAQKNRCMGCPGLYLALHSCCCAAQKVSHQLLKITLLWYKTSA